MEPVSLSHRDRGPPPPSSSAMSSLPLRLPPLSAVHSSGDSTSAAADELDDDDATGSKNASSNYETALRRLEEDRLLAAVLADQNSGHDLGRQKVGGGRASHGATVNRRNRRSRSPLLATRMLGQHPALLDDLCPRLAARLLGSVHRWQFNAFLLDRLTGGRCLPTLCLHLFHKSGLLAHFRMDPADVLAFFRLVERGYHTANPYHNALHACDVTQAMYVFCRQAAIRPHLTPLDLLAALVAAVGHDLDHPGVNEKFLVATGSHLAVLYDNVSVLENHHWRSAVSCFVEAGLARYLAEAQLAEFTDLVRALILATDISRQQEFLAQFRYVMDSSSSKSSTGNAAAVVQPGSGGGGGCKAPTGLDTLLGAAPHHRHFILQIAIKCADISNPCRAWPVSRLWSLRACEEFFRQGDREREEISGGGGIVAVTPICDRFNVTVAKVQVGFYTFVVEPLFREWHRFLASRLSAAMLANFAANQQRWEAEVLLEDGHLSSDEETVEVSVADEAEDEEVLVDPADGMAEGDESVDVVVTKRAPVPTSAAMKTSSLGTMSSSSATVAGAAACLDRRMSLPSSHQHHQRHLHHLHNDPLHRIFDQMLQPDSSTASTMLLMTADSGGGGGGGSVSLRRNYSLTDRRRSSLLRGLYTRSSLKPTGGGVSGGVAGRVAGRLSRPSSACLETAAESTMTTAITTGACQQPPCRTLQPMENRIEEAAPSLSSTGNFDLSGGGVSFADDQQQKQQLLAVITRNLGSRSAADTDSDDENSERMIAMLMMRRTAAVAGSEDGEKENTDNSVAASSSFHLYQRLTQRRGSAPSNLVLGDTSAKVNNSGLGRQQQQMAVTCVNSSSVCGTNRRGSLPSELLADSLPKQLRSRIHAAGGGSGGKSKGLLRRRSMGPEMLMNLNNLHQQQRPQLVQKYMNRPF